MPRTNAKAVTNIVKVNADISVLPFIKTAAALTDWLATADTAQDGELTSDLLREIETYLAAHFYSHRDQLYQSKGTGRANASFQGQTAMKLESTQYGQTAMVLDITGLLAARNAGPKNRVQVVWLGKPKSQQTRYDQRD